jgi:cation transport ATPase
VILDLRPSERVPVDGRVAGHSWSMKAMVGEPVPVEGTGGHQRDSQSGRALVIRRLRGRRRAVASSQVRAAQAELPIQALVDR